MVPAILSRPRRSCQMPGGSRRSGRPRRLRPLPPNRILGGNQAMERRPHSQQCPRCSSFNGLEAAYCNQCGAALAGGAGRAGGIRRKRLALAAAVVVTAAMAAVLLSPRGGGGPARTAAVHDPGPEAAEAPEETTTTV